MNDRELLDLAAKAAGLDYMARALVQWNPLEKNEDAFLLAINLNMQIDFRDPETRVYAAPSGVVGVHHGKNKHAATRFAITKAAAEIGKVMIGFDVEPS